MVHFLHWAILRMPLNLNRRYIACLCCLRVLVLSECIPSIHCGWTKQSYFSSHKMKTHLSTKTTRTANFLASTMNKQLLAWALIDKYRCVFIFPLDPEKFHIKFFFTIFVCYILYSNSYILFCITGSSWYRKEEEKIRIKEAVRWPGINKAKSSWFWGWELDLKFCQLQTTYWPPGKQ